jgi:hypothetical protein
MKCKAWSDWDYGWINGKEGKDEYVFRFLEASYFNLNIVGGLFKIYICLFCAFRTVNKGGSSPEYDWQKKFLQRS